MRDADSYCDLFAQDDTPVRGLYSVHLQFPRLWLNLIAKNLSFAPRIVDFVAETRDRPEYMDTDLGGGRFRTYTPLKSVDLSASFWKARFTMTKDEEYGDRYVIHIDAMPKLSLTFTVSGGLLDSFLEELRDIDWRIQSKW